MDKFFDKLNLKNHTMSNINSYDYNSQNYDKYIPLVIIVSLTTVGIGIVFLSKWAFKQTKVRVDLVPGISYSLITKNMTLPEVRQTSTLADVTGSQHVEKQFCDVDSHTIISEVLDSPAETLNKAEQHPKQHGTRDCLESRCSGNTELSTGKYAVDSQMDRHMKGPESRPDQCQDRATTSSYTCATVSHARPLNLDKMVIPSFQLLLESESYNNSEGNLCQANSSSLERLQEDSPPQAPQECGSITVSEEHRRITKQFLDICSKSKSRDICYGFQLELTHL